MGAHFVVVGASNPDLLRLLEDFTQTHPLKTEAIAFVDQKFSKDFQTFWGFSVVGPLSVLELEDFDASVVVNTVASSMKQRKVVTDYLSSIGRQASSVVASDVPTTDIRIGKGVLVYLNTYIGAGVEIDDDSVISDSARVGHETSIGSHSFVGPGVVICGRVKVGDLAYVGAGATILPGLSIGHGAVVGAGSVVTKDVADGTTVAGNPARTIR